MTSVNQLLLSVFRFLSFISIAAHAYTRNRLHSKHAITTWKSQSAFSSAHGLPCCSISPSALFTTGEENQLSDKVPDSNGQKDDLKFPDTAPLTYSDFHVITRTQSTDEIKHLELYLKWRKGGTLLSIAFNVRCL
jgi:hypothetical protein